MVDLCYKKDICKNHPNLCGNCSAQSDIYNHYPLFKDKDEIKVVMCKDCKYTDGVVNQCGDIYCRLIGHFDANGYCSYGERREQ
jgi:hypothetical protein